MAVPYKGIRNVAACLGLSMNHEVTVLPSNHLYNFTFIQIRNSHGNDVSLNMQGHLAYHFNRLISLFVLFYLSDMCRQLISPKSINPQTMDSDEINQPESMDKRLVGIK